MSDINLTEKEYQVLKGVVEKYNNVDTDRNVLQEVCTYACNTIPVNVDWMDLVKPWRCILNPEGNGTGYCDYCPVEDYCPHIYKKWSK